MVAYGGFGLCKKEFMCNLGDGNTLNSCDSCLRWQVALSMAYTWWTQRPNTICPVDCNPCMCLSRATTCFVSILEPLLPLRFITAISPTFDRFCVHWDGNQASDWGHEKKNGPWRAGGSGNRKRYTVNKQGGAVMERELPTLISSQHIHGAISQPGLWSTCLLLPSWDLLSPAISPMTD